MVIVRVFNDLLFFFNIDMIISERFYLEYKSILEGCLKLFLYFVYNNMFF